MSPDLVLVTRALAKRALADRAVGKAGGFDAAERTTGRAGLFGPDYAGALFASALRGTRRVRKGGP